MTCTCNRDSAMNSQHEEFCKGCGMLIHACKCTPIPEKVSIIIPAYNAEKYINDAISNVLRQTYENIEVIVVDDGSTDKTLINLLRDPLSKQIKIIEKENGGVGSALNAGIKAMTGEWFKWLSADDHLEKNCIEIMMNHIHDTKNYKDKIFYIHYEVIDPENKILDIVIEPDRNNMSLAQKSAHLYDNYYGNATTCMIHKSVFERAGLFDETIKNGDDYDFWLRCLFGHDIELYLIPEVLASYRKHPEQLTNRRGAELFITVQKIREKNLNLLPIPMQKQILHMVDELDKKPLKVKIRRKIRNIIFSIMPTKFNNKLLATYQERKKR